jgi:5-methylcytosine-specific restriction protein A
LAVRVASPRVTVRPTRVQQRPRDNAPFYSTPEWRTLVAQIISRRGRRCEKCHRSQKEDGSPVRIFADHIVELNDGGAKLDPNNIQLLCGSCHTSKTMASRGERMATVY